MRLAVAFIVAVCSAVAQDFGQNVLLGFGAANPVSGTSTQGLGTSPVLTFNYGWRFSRYGQFDAGVDTVWGQLGDRSRMHYIPAAGYRAILPLWNDRVELSGGGGGAYLFAKPKPSGYNTWLVYGMLEANYALDRDRRVRAGFLLRWYRDPVGRPSHQWINTGVAVSYQFGKVGL
jgi:hypothetical protein